MLSPMVNMIFIATYFPVEIFSERQTSPDAPELIMFTSLSIVGMDVGECGYVEIDVTCTAGRSHHLGSRSSLCTERDETSYWYYKVGAYSMRSDWDELGFESVWMEVDDGDTVISMSEACDLFECSTLVEFIAFALNHPWAPSSLQILSSPPVTFLRLCFSCGLFCVTNRGFGTCRVAMLVLIWTCMKWSCLVLYVSAI